MRTSIPISAVVAVVNILLLPLKFHQAYAFVRNYHSPMTPTTGSKRGTVPTTLWYTDSPDTVSEMNASELRKKLESYGISTEPQLGRNEFEREKTELHTASPPTDTKTKSTSKNNMKTIRDMWSSKWEDVASVAKDALRKYAAKGFSSDASIDASSEENHQLDDQESEVSSSSPSTSQTMASTRSKRYDIALEEGESMRISSLKQELKDRGISTGSFFEKSDLVKAYANAVADGVRAKGSKTRNNDSRNSEQRLDPTYRTVTMRAFDPSTLTVEDVLIDI